MGYNTAFHGVVKINPPLNAAEISILTSRLDGPQDPGSTPGWVCGWSVRDGDRIEWDGGDKFEHADIWMAWVIDLYLRPGAILDTEEPELREAGFTFDHVCNGKIEARGDDWDDHWQILVDDNTVYRCTNPRISWRDKHRVTPQGM